MSLATPIILLPSAVYAEMSTNSVGIIISGSTVAATTSMDYQYAVYADSFTGTPVYSSSISTGLSFSALTTAGPSTLPWSFDSSFLTNFVVGTKLYLKFFAHDSVHSQDSLPATFLLHMASYSDTLLSSPTPTGVSVTRSNVALTVKASSLPAGSYVGNFIGFNYYCSLTSGGGSSGYQRMNKDYVTVPNSNSVTTMVNSVSTAISGGVAIETKVSTYNNVPVYEFALTSDVLGTLVSEGKLPDIRYTDDTMFYFVVTSVLYDTSTGTVVESLYSPETKSRFLTFIPSFEEMPPRNRDDILLSLAKRLNTLNKSANITSGSVYRDILDPVSEEFADAYIVQDFLSRSQSVDGLIQFDDANGDGVSDPVSTSFLKKRLQVAMNVSNDIVMQNIINSAFDKLASNFSVSRLSPTYATGKVVFYTLTVPSEGLYITDGATVTAQGSSGALLRFLVQGAHTLYFTDKDRFYNPASKRYEVICDAVAAVTGTESNVAAGAITSLASGADTRWRVVNSTPFYGGTQTESNISLANRTRLAMSGLDTGTEGGYAAVAIGTPGVKYAKVVKGGDVLMHRDLDAVTGTHIGGKVDVYVQGDLTAQEQDTFAFSYGGPSGSEDSERFLIEDAESFMIRTDSPLVTAATPIFDVRKVVNVTRSASYDLAGAVIGTGDGDTVILAQNSTNLAIGMATLDIIEVEYHYRGYNSYTLSHQPVKEIISVTGDIDGLLPKENYNLVKLEDPLLLGDSTGAHDGVEILFLRGYPTESLSVVSNEQHVMVLDKSEKLAKKGVDADTIVVSSDPSQSNVYDHGLDYRVVRGGDTGYTEISLMPASRIRSGTLVYISYNAGQNFTVVYTHNKMLENVQNRIDVTKHAAADAVVKQAVGNDIDISVKVIRKSGYSENTVVNSITNAISAYVQNLKIGIGFHLDDMVNIVKNTDGVRTVQLPPYRMMKANGSFIAKDLLGLLDFKVFNQNASKGVTSYISVDPALSYGTTDGGGPTNMFRTIYEDSTPLVLASSALDVSSAMGRGYIRGDGRIVVSTTDGMPPQTKQYQAAYYTYVPSANEFSADITVDYMEYLTVGPNSISIDASVEEPLNRSR